VLAKQRGEMITLAHLNAVQISDGILRVDRKFHSGMLEYTRGLPEPIVTVNPALEPGQPIMDAVEVPVATLPYEPHAIRSDRGPDHVHPFDRARLKALISGSRLLYGDGLDTATLARESGVPYVLVLEYDRQTHLQIIDAQAHSPLRRWVRRVKHLRRHWQEIRPNVRNAHSVHCNGYPVYEEAAADNPNRLLYFDSRMSERLVISAEALEQRLEQRRPSSLRLLYSGRYERLKGADDAVRVVAGLLREGLDVELDCYGQGGLRGEMQALAGGDRRIRIHDALPYPELVRITQGKDAFLCCHIQNDPSCTYVESMGAGLPIFGYGNRMWQGLQRESQAGECVKVGDVFELSRRVTARVREKSWLEGASRRARAFALEHSFEREFDKRVHALRGALERSGSQRRDGRR